MPAVKKSVVPIRKALPTKTTRDSSDDLSLPTKVSTPSQSFQDYTWLIYGDRKIGKTSLVAQFDKTFIMSFEPGTKALEVMQRDVPKWEHFKKYVELLKDDKEFKTVAIDTGALAYERCMEFVCARDGMEHPSDGSYGKGWKAVQIEFMLQHSDLFNTGKGIFVLAHSKEKTITSLSGTEYQVIGPDLSGQADGYYAGVIDNICYYHYMGKKRYLRIRGSENVIAGTRCEGKFLTPGGEQIVNIPMGNCAEEAHANLLKAFNNKQTDTYADVGRVITAKPKS